MDKNQDLFVWESVSSPDELARRRRSAMNMFLKDYDSGRRDGRYRAACLPCLPFFDNSYDLALCSHFLFYYSETFTGSFHREVIAEMMRVSSGTRIFPLVDLNGRTSRYHDTIATKLRKAGFEVEIRNVPYEFLRGCNQAMIISRGD